MNGAESLMSSLYKSGVRVCFANPGTSELHLVDALSRSKIRPVLTLFEGAASGAACGYAQMSGKPAVNIFHLGPGFSNAMANLHNARRAHVPLINIVGDHPDRHLEYDVPLTSDIESMAKAVSAWVHRIKNPGAMSKAAADAVRISQEREGQSVTLIVPSDCSWGQAGKTSYIDRAVKKKSVPSSRISRIAGILKKSGQSTLLLMDGKALYGKGIESAGRIAAKTGAALYSVILPSRIDRGRGRVSVERFPYFGDQVADLLSFFKNLVLVSAKEPATFFAYPGKTGRPIPDNCAVYTLCSPEEDCVDALRALAFELGAEKSPPDLGKEKPVQEHKNFDPYGMGSVISELLPEGAIISDESVTSSLLLFQMTAGARPHTWLCNPGGAIGLGIPLAAGAAYASPESKLICITGDGSAMYTIQSLWTLAREKLDVVVIIISNRKYLILDIEMQRLNLNTDGASRSMLDLSGPNLDFVSMASGMGVKGKRASSLIEFRNAFAFAMNNKGPHLIEAVI